MSKMLLLILGLLVTFPANAQFAAGYRPSYEQEDTGDAPSVPAYMYNRPAPLKPREPEIPTAYTGSIRILATVNGDIITTEDINNRVRAFVMNTMIPFNDQTKLLIINKVMQNTIDEKLKLQEAERNQIDISEKEIDNAIQSFAANNGTTLENLKQMLNKYEVNEDVFREQMRTDMAWIRVVRKGTASDQVTQLEIQEALELTKKDMSKNKYMVSEIILSKDEAKHINELIQNLKRDPRFELYAAEFSISPSSSSGGKLGWITEGQLPSQLENAVKKLSEEEISNPILYEDDYYIFKLEKKFDPDKDELPIPSVYEIKSILEGQKAEKYAAQLMQSLRQKASIELRE
jgi:peptidyl-prolyl cis-trans isomerase SurA